MNLVRTFIHTCPRFLLVRFLTPVPMKSGAKQKKMNEDTDARIDTMIVINEHRRKSQTMFENKLKYFSVLRS